MVFSLTWDACVWVLQSISWNMLHIWYTCTYKIYTVRLYSLSFSSSGKYACVSCIYNTSLEERQIIKSTERILYSSYALLCCCSSRPLSIVDLPSFLQSFYFTFRQLHSYLCVYVLYICMDNFRKDCGTSKWSDGWSGYEQEWQQRQQWRRRWMR